VFGQPPGEFGFGNANGVTFAAELDGRKHAGTDQPRSESSAAVA
jgi:hypothetical protein